MKIKYRHHSEPEKLKIYDTVKAHKKMPASLTDKEMTQDEFDEFELAHFEKDKSKGVILHYEVVKAESGGANV